MALQITNEQYHLEEKTVYRVKEIKERLNEVLNEGLECHQGERYFLQQIQKLLDGSELTQNELIALFIDLAHDHKYNLAVKLLFFTSLCKLRGEDRITMMIRRSAFQRVIITKNEISEWFLESTIINDQTNYHKNLLKSAIFLSDNEISILIGSSFNKEN